MQVFLKRLLAKNKLQKPAVVDLSNGKTTCFHCGKSKGVLDFDYSGFKIDKGSYPFLLSNQSAVPDKYEYG